MSVFRGRWVPACIVALAVSPVTAAGQDAVDLSGEIRTRSEYGDPAGGEADGFTLLRTRVGLTAEPLEYARVFVQVQDSRVWGEELGTLEGSADAFDLHQGYVELFREGGGHHLRVRAGRQRIALGNERLVGAVGWSNVGRVFDGARLDLRDSEGAWTASGFVTTIREAGAPPAGSGDGTMSGFDDQIFGGVWVAFPDYDLWLLQGLNAVGGPGTNVDRTTLGGRVHRRVGRLSYEFEGAYQLGDFVPQGAGINSGVRDDISAWMAGGRLNLEMEEETGPLRGLGAGLDWLSGDPDGVLNQDGDHRAFDVLFHTGHRWYGYMDLFGNPLRGTSGRGLVDALATVRTMWGDEHAVPVTATVHRFSMAEDAGLDAGDLGWELDVTAPYPLGGAGSVQAGYSVFFAGDGAPEIGLAEADETRHWAYLQLTLGF